MSDDDVRRLLEVSGPCEEPPKAVRDRVYAAAHGVLAGVALYGTANANGLVRGGRGPCSSGYHRLVCPDLRAEWVAGRGRDRPRRG